MSNSKQITAQFAELLQRYIRLRPNLILPEHVIRFKQQLEGLQNSSPGSSEDHIFILRIFVILAYREIPPTMGELSADLNVPLSSATRIVDWLVCGDFVERIADPNDRRVVRVRMTESGWQFYLVGVVYLEQRIMRLLAVFSPDEQAQLLVLMNKLMDALLVETY